MIRVVCKHHRLVTLQLVYRVIHLLFVIPQCEIDVFFGELIPGQMFSLFALTADPRVVADTHDMTKSDGALISIGVRVLWLVTLVDGGPPLSTVSQMQECATSWGQHF